MMLLWTLQPPCFLLSHLASGKAQLNLIKREWPHGVTLHRAKELLTQETH